MKKTIVTVITLVCVLLLFCSCSDKSTDNQNSTSLADTSIHNYIESTETPESVVLRNISIAENVTYEIIHNYDASSHIDDVKLITYYNGKFGTRTTTYTYAYQYNRSTDLWTLISGDNGMQSDVITLSEEGYKNKTFTGDFSQAHSGTYSISVKSLDLSNKNVTIEYSIVFNDDYSVLSSVETFELYTTNDENLCFVIPYSRSRIVRFELFFILDIDEGICA